MPEVYHGFKVHNFIDNFDRMRRYLFASGGAGVALICGDSRFYRCFKEAIGVDCYEEESCDKFIGKTCQTDIHGEYFCNEDNAHLPLPTLVARGQ